MNTRPITNAALQSCPELQLNEAELNQPATIWQKLSTTAFAKKRDFAWQKSIHEELFGDWNTVKHGPVPWWWPTEHEMQHSNLARYIADQGFADFDALYRHSTENTGAFWQDVIARLGIDFVQPASDILQQPIDYEAPQWLPGATFNIASSCFLADADAIAIRHQKQGGAIENITYAQLQHRATQIAKAIQAAGFAANTPLAIAMPMSADAIAIYLGIALAGCVVVSIADSFSASEIATRLQIAKAEAVFTTDVIVRGIKSHPLYQRVIDAAAKHIIVLKAAETLQCELRATDITFERFLDRGASAASDFHAVSCSANTTLNILFSSGTTGTPKAIPWSHTTPIKCAMDGYFHQDIQVGDVVAWPTNLGWMMGPWLIFATLINRGCIALFEGDPSSAAFGEFIQDAKVNMLGVVPILVKSWRNSGCMEAFDWRSIKLFSSTGECSNASDYAYLMYLGHMRPVIEYCGGTEIGGAYISGSILHPAAPGHFTTPTLGIKMHLLDSNSQEAPQGEVYLIPPSIGLSTHLINASHHDIYFQDTPALQANIPSRRHSDQIEQMPGGFLRGHGRSDDTMNLGGIKISSVEIENVVKQLPWVEHCAAIGVTPEGGGPEQLVLYVTTSQNASKDRDEMQQDAANIIKKRLNPLFKLSNLVCSKQLPRTSSGKLMRRTLRDQYLQ